MLPAQSLGAEFVTQDELLSQSDFIVLAVPLTNETKLMINKDTLGKMKSNAILVNVGRGGTPTLFRCFILPHT